MPPSSDWLSWGFWANTTEGLNHLALIVGGTIGIVLLAIRTFAANKSAKAADAQARTTAQRHDEQTKADRERRITESFAKAVELLGSNNLETRLGAIYTLERISKEKQSEHDYYWPIMETLTAYVRERAPRQATAEQPKDATEQTSAQIRPATDIQAVLTVLGRRDETACEQDQAAGRRLDLAKTNLRGAYLGEAQLKGAEMSGAHLEDAYLEGARLEGAYLGEACLQGATLDGAHLKGARLWTRVEFLDGEPFKAIWHGGAHLDGAWLVGAHLEGTDLRGALGLTKDQLAKAYGDARTKVADELRPESWPAPAPGAQTRPAHGALVASPYGGHAWWQL